MSEQHVHPAGLTGGKGEHSVGLTPRVRPVSQSRSKMEAFQVQTLTGKPGPQCPTDPPFSELPQGLHTLLPSDLPLKQLPTPGCPRHQRHFLKPTDTHLLMSQFHTHNPNSHSLSSVPSLTSPPSFLDKVSLHVPVTGTQQARGAVMSMSPTATDRDGIPRIPSGSAHTPPVNPS